MLRRIAAVFAALLPHPLRPMRRLAAGERARVMSAARREEAGGMPVLYLAGSHFEMGYQHGALAREGIHAFRADAYAYMTDLIRQAMSWPAWLARLLARPLLFWQASAYWETMPPEYLEEARGVAAGSGVHPLEVVLVTAIWEMYLVGGCSEFALTGRMTEGGSLIHGYNYDLMAPEHALINPHLAMIFYRPQSGIGFSTLNTVGSIGVNAGMSDAGLSVAWDNTYTRDGSLFQGIALPVVPFIVTLRRVLETCRTLEEGLRLVTDTLPRPLADIIILASAGESRAVALETAGRLHAERPIEGDAVWSTNSFRSAELAPFERNGDWREMGSEAAARAFPRYASYAGLFERHRGRVTPRLALEILRDPYPREAEGELYHRIAHRSTICREATGFSLIMQPGLGLVWGSDGKLPAPHGRFFAFDQRGWKRRPDLDLPPSGFRAALACAEAHLRGDPEAARAALEEALAVDGESAPLLLMRSVLLGARADGEPSARADLEKILGRFGKTAIGALARAWSEGRDAELPPIPFPSAIAPRLAFHAAAEPAARVRRAAESFDLAKPAVPGARPSAPPGR
jgi:predicted choloylglycine hydrolase